MRWLACATWVGCPCPRCRKYVDAKLNILVILMIRTMYFPSEKAPDACYVPILCPVEILATPLHLLFSLVVRLRTPLR